MTVAQWRHQANLLRPATPILAMPAPQAHYASQTGDLLVYAAHTKLAEALAACAPHVRHHSGLHVEHAPYPVARACALD